MRVIITGGAGFIGSHLIDKLIGQNYQIICFDNLSTGVLDNISHHKNNKNFKFIKGELEDIKTIKRLIKASDVIFHLAAVVGVSNVLENPIKGININSRASSFLTEAAFEFKKKLIFTSSSECYGKNSLKSFKEDSDSVFGPPTVPRWSYALSKLLEEHLILSYCKMGLKATVARLFNVYGPRSKNPVYSNVIPKFIELALKGEDLLVYGTGLQTRSFTYVDDTVNALNAIFKSKKTLNEVINIGRDKPISILKLAEKVIKLTNSKSRIRFIKQGNDFEDPLIRIPNSSKLINLTGYKCSHTLEDGIKKTILWYKNKI